MRIRVKTWTIPIALLVICGLGFGLLIPLLGFFWDDWPAITTIRLLGVDAFWNFYRGERPLSAWTFILFGPLFGTNQLLWHSFTLLMRWLTVLGMWWSLQLLWPKRKTEVTWMAFLFAIYPIFTQQPIAVAFSQHWITFCLYFFSIGLMLFSTRKQRGYLPLTILAMAMSILHMLTMEYFIGLELLRPFFLWIIFEELGASCRKRLQKTFIRWLPYLVLLVGVVIWRLFFMGTFIVDPNDPVLLRSLLSQPLTTSLQLLQLAITELIGNLLGAWYATLDPQKFDLTNSLYVASLALGIFSAILATLYLLNLKADHDQDPVDGKKWHRQAIIVGFLAAIFGSLPIWITDRHVLTGLYGGRFGLAAMFGMSILLVGLLDWFTPRRTPKIILIGVLIGMAVGFHLRSTSTYVNSWVKQHNFYWQLYWRAPYLRPGTALLSMDELFIYVGRSPTSMALNLLYPQPTGSRELAYWFVELPYHVGPLGIPEFVAGKNIRYSFRKYSFTGSSLDGLAIFYEPEGGRCLWVLSPLDRYNPEIPGMTEEVLPISNLERIEPNASSQGYPLVGIFGKEPHHSWCYYYQKVDLARQLSDWGRVVELYDEALEIGLKPENPHERLPFIEAFARTGRWQEAIRQTNKAFQKNHRYAAQLCYLWKRIEGDLEIPAEFNQQLRDVLAPMLCQ